MVTVGLDGVTRLWHPLLVSFLKGLMWGEVGKISWDNLLCVNPLLFHLCLSQVFQTHTLLGHSGPVSAAAVSEASGLLLTTSEDGSIRLWEVPKEAGE